MCPRPYRLARRAQSLEDTRRRILDATVALHAERGSLATSYADVAARADVAVPTVYKHFPTRAALIQGCTSHASEQAPPFGPEIFARAADRAARLRALVEASYQRHAYYEPWMRHREERADPDLAAVLASFRPAIRAMIDAALSDGDRPAPPGVSALTEVLIDYPAWETLVRQHGLSIVRAVDMTVQAIEAAFDPPSEGAPR